MKPLASLSLDLDNEWSYLKTRGDPRWEAFPSYLDVVVPRALELLDELGFSITFFVVGQDAALEKNRSALAALARSGHEIGCHSLRHEPWLHLYAEDELERELAEAEREIEAATGQRPRGFRGPGFSLSETTLRVLVRRGYRYDATTLPTFIGPLARAYYFMASGLDAAERARRRLLFGSAREGLRPLRPYRWRLGPDTLLEIPVTTFPLLRVPIHVSYVLYLSAFSATLARGYFASALRACRLRGIEPSLLLHPLDFLGPADAPSLAFFPAMQIPASIKLARVRAYVSMLAKDFQVGSVGAYAEALRGRSDLPEVAPRFTATSATPPRALSEQEAP